MCVRAAVSRCQQQRAATLGEVAAYLDWRLPGALPAARLRAAVDALLARDAVQVEHLCRLSAGLCLGSRVSGARCLFGWRAASCRSSSLYLCLCER